MIAVFLTFCSPVALVLVVSAFYRWQDRRGREQRQLMRIRRCPLCGLCAVVSEHGYRTHLALCERRVT